VARLHRSPPRGRGAVVRQIAIAAIFATGVACGATVTPTSPSFAAAPPCSAHGVTATDESGRLWHVCATQPRRYCHPGGSCQDEVDHYIQASPCPGTPID